MKLVATRDGRKIELQAADKPFAWTPNGLPLPTKATGTAESQLAGLTLKLSGKPMYTGQYLVNIDVTPNGKGGLDCLDLEVPVSDPVDVVFAYDPRDSAFYSKAHPWTGDPRRASFWNNLSSGPSVRSSCTSATASGGSTGTPTATRASGSTASSRTC